MSTPKNGAGANLCAMAVGAHPDDIEFMMAGTMTLLGKAGCELHVMNVATGSCGTATPGRDRIVEIRTAEARASAARLGAEFHPPLADDIEILYEMPLLRKLAAVVRRVAPNILLLQSPQDYMEDHMNACRLMVTAAFCRSMPNFVTDPETPPVPGNMAVYHALPYGLCDALRQPVSADFYVDITRVLPHKRALLAEHRSQKEWLDESQGLDSYLTTMEEMSAEAGRRSAAFDFAEGWRRRSHLGFAVPDYDPLRAVLPDDAVAAGSNAGN